MALMVSALQLTTLLLAATPVSISLEPIQSDVEALPGARLTALMTTALRQAATASQVDLVDSNAQVNVTGRFAAQGKGYRLSFVVRSPTASKPLAFDYKTTGVGEAGALKIAEVIVREAQNVAAAAPKPRPVAATTSTGPVDNGPVTATSFDDESNVNPKTIKEPVEPAAPNSIWAEGGGPALAYSINYERRFFDDLGVRAGVEYLPLSVSGGGSSATNTTLAFPIGVSYLGVRSGKHGLEVGGGVTIYANAGSASAGGTTASGSAVFPLGWVQAGYRYHPVKNAGFNFRIGVMGMIGGAPLYSLAYLGVGAHIGTAIDGPNIVPWGYISLGASF